MPARILALRLNDQTEVLWPADSTLARVGGVCAGLLPFVMVGPHHGAPSDYRGQDAPVAIAKVSPRCAFISVGTKNPYSHPRPKYLQRLERTGCRVICSQITTACDRTTTVLNPRPIMSTHLALGLRPPRTGLACRGAWRLRWNGSVFESDGFDDEHVARISPLRPQCLKGRASFEAQA
jgi:hypothetical protein